jgi:hypothetical protein
MTGVIVKLGRLSGVTAGRLFGWPCLSKSGSDGTPAARRKSSGVALSAVALLSLIPSILANPARAGVGDHAGSLFSSLQQSSPVEAIQYYSLNNSDYCWYGAGWQGPGWYSCGYEWNDGLGWGGPYGWNGWGVGHRIRQHGSHGVGVWHPGPAPHVFSGGAPVSPGLPGVAPASPGLVRSGVPHFHGLGAPASPRFAGSRALGFHGVGGVAPASPRFAGSGAPGFHGVGGVASASPRFSGSGALGFHGVGGGPQAFHGFGGGAPAFQGLGGGASAFHGFSAVGGFHGGGGGGAFSFGGPGGIGHR